MTGAGTPPARSTGRRSGSHPPPAPGSPRGDHGVDPREQWPRDFGRDGVSGLVSLDRALRARDVSRPDAEDEQLAHTVLADLLARADGRRPTSR